MITFPCISYDTLKEDVHLSTSKRDAPKKKITINLESFNNINFYKNITPCPTLRPKNLITSDQVFFKKNDLEDDDLQVIDYPYQNKRLESDRFFDFVPPIIPSKDENWIPENNMINCNFNKILVNEKNDENNLKSKKKNELSKNDNKNNMNNNFISDNEKNNIIKVKNKTKTKKKLINNNKKYITINNTEINNDDATIYSNTNSITNTNSIKNKNKKNKSFRCITNYSNKNDYYNTIEFGDLREKAVSHKRQYSNKLYNKTEKNIIKLIHKASIQKNNIINDQFYSIKKRFLNNNFYNKININNPKSKTGRGNNKKFLSSNNCHNFQDFHRAIAAKKILYTPYNEIAINNNFKCKSKSKRFFAECKFNQLLNRINKIAFPKSGRKSCFSSNYNSSGLDNTENIKNNNNNVQISLKSNVSLTTTDVFNNKFEKLKSFGKRINTPIYKKSILNLKRSNKY